MRTLASFIFTSLDGFYEGPNGEIDWANVDAEFNEFAVRQLDEADTLCFGRATYEHMAAYWPTEQAMANDPAITSRMNDKEKLVFSTTLTDASWSGTTVVRGEASKRLPTIKAAAGEELLVLGSAHLTANLAQAGLLDELRVMVCPIVLGQGRSLFEDLKERVSLNLLRVRRFESGNLVLTYRPSGVTPDALAPSSGMSTGIGDH
jgi:dihydrofolate reductase